VNADFKAQNAAFMADIEAGIARGKAIVARLTALVDQLAEINGSRRIRNLRAAMAREPDLLKPWPKRTSKPITLDTGEIVIPAKGRTVATAYLRRPYDAADIAMLRTIAAAQPRTVTYEQVMEAKSKRKVDQAEIARVRKGIEL